MTAPTARGRGHVGVHARRVALGASLLALCIYVVACLIADLVVVSHLDGAIDARLASRLASLANLLPRDLSAGTPIATELPVASDDDLDDAPILAWFVPRDAAAVPLVENAPALPRADFGISGPVDRTLGSRRLRLAGRATARGRLIAATSDQEVSGVLSTLLIIEGSLAPVALLSLFGAATLIGRRAAAPIEAMRVRQLEFTADASHELRTPLSVIEAEIGLALSSHRSADEYRLALERIAGESQRLRAVVDDLLWLARLDALPAGPPDEPVDLAAVASGCVERFRPIASQRGLSLDFAEPDTLPAIVVAPAEWLDRLVAVLLDNACRYAGTTGAVAVTVSATEDRVSLTVDDNGPGFAPDQRAHLLERFHRASDLPGGAGLGLAIAHAVVQATGGELDLATAPLGGARVCSVWPRVLSGPTTTPPRALRSRSS